MKTTASTVLLQRALPLLLLQAALQGAAAPVQAVSKVLRSTGGQQLKHTVQQADPRLTQQSAAY